MTALPHRVRAALAVPIVLLLACVANAQVDGAILAGTVVDPSGAAVVNATITVRNMGTDVVTVDQTNVAGAYVAPNLRPGEYTVSADAPGLALGALPTRCRGVLVMMRERAGQLNGTFDFDSAPGCGATIRVVIPFR